MPRGWRKLIDRGLIDLSPGPEPGARSVLDELASTLMADLDAGIAKLDALADAGLGHDYHEPEWWSGYRSAVGDLRSGIVRWKERRGQRVRPSGEVA